MPETACLFILKWCVYISIYIDTDLDTYIFYQGWMDEWVDRMIMEVSPYLHSHSVFSPWNICPSAWVTTKDCRFVYDTG